jgi:hypothetical protein
VPINGKSQHSKETTIAAVFILEKSFLPMQSKLSYGAVQGGIEMKKAVENRKSERTDDLVPTLIEIRQKSFRVNDISPEGIGIILTDTSDVFHMGERLDRVILPVDGGKTALKGIVTHLSASDSKRVCGIRFLFDSSKEFDAVARFRKERRRDPSKK